MNRLLRIDSGARVLGSHSRILADHYQHLWEKENIGGIVVGRDLALKPIPHLSNEEIAAFQDKSNAFNPDTSLSDMLCAEVCSASHLLITSPLYNLSMPSTLKAWMDHIARPGLTFDVINGKYCGLLTGITVTVITSRGSISKSDHMDDFQSEYIKSFFSMLGIGSIEVIGLEGTSLPAEDRLVYFDNAKSTLENHFEQLAL
jgi:FMN-dependent NADH-azoreductase